MAELSQRIWKLSQEKRRFVDTPLKDTLDVKVPFSKSIVTLYGHFDSAGKGKLLGYHFGGDDPVEWAYLESWCELISGKDLAQSEQMSDREIENFLRDSNHLRSHSEDPKYSSMVKSLITATAILWWKSLWFETKDEARIPISLKKVSQNSRQYIDRILSCQAIFQFLSKRLTEKQLSKIQLIEVAEGKLVYDFQSPELITQCARETFPYFLHEILSAHLPVPTPICVAE